MHDWRKIVLKETDPLNKAIQVLNDEALRIVLVVDESNRLTGTLTDGDIRRGLLKQISLEVQLKEVMFTEPTIALENESRESILIKMKQMDLLQVPIVNHQGEVVGLETLNELLKVQKKSNAVFLMAGGFGKRLLPLTKSTPKPLLKVGQKPILQTILESFIEQGFSRFFISTHYKAEQVEKHFGNGKQWGADIAYVYEETPLGTAGALGLMPEIPVQPLIVMNGDLLTKVNFEELLSYHEQQQSVATMCVREYDFQVPYGVVKATGSSIREIVEKPTHKFFVNAGIYVLNPEIIAQVSGYGFLNMPDLLRGQINSDKNVSMFPIHEYWLDIGQKEEFEQAQVDVMDLID